MTNSLIIRKQKFRIKTNNEEVALQLRSQVNDELQYNLLNVYEEVLSTLSNEDIYIDKIKVDLGPCTKEEIKEKLPRMLREALFKQLKYPSPGHGLVEPNNGTDEKQRSASGITHDENSALFYFFKQGVYPWWYKGSTFKSPEEILSAMSDANMESLLVKIISAVQKNEDLIGERIRQRFIQHLSPLVHKKIVDALILLQSDQQVKRNLEMIAGKETIKYLANILRLSEDTYREKLITYLLKYDSVYQRDILKNFIEFLFEEVRSYDRNHLKFYNETFPERKTKSRLEKLVVDIILKGKSQQAPEKRTEGKQTELQKKEPNKPSSTVIENFPEEGIYIENAGLVILHPFLQPLFTNLGLMEADAAFISVVTKQKAAVILNYLQNADTAYREYEMALNKVLCGMAIEEVLPTDIELNENEKKECNELLQTVINYWEALKGASSTALQETFFRRSAKLNFIEDHWLLQVERNATDILLDRLPWSFGIIKLPWLEHLIHVEW